MWRASFKSGSMLLLLSVLLVLAANPGYSVGNASCGIQLAAPEVILARQVFTCIFPKYFILGRVRGRINSHSLSLVIRTTSFVLLPPWGKNETGRKKGLVTASQSDCSSHMTVQQLLIPYCQHDLDMFDC